MPLARTEKQLESDLEDIIGGLQEYEGYVDLVEASRHVAALEALIEAAGEAQESDHEDDETTEDEDEDTDSE